MPGKPVRGIEAFFHPSFVPLATQPDPIIRTAVSELPPQQLFSGTVAPWGDTVATVVAARHGAGRRRPLQRIGAAVVAAGGGGVSGGVAGVALGGEGAVVAGKVAVAAVVEAVDASESVGDAGGDVSSAVEMKINSISIFHQRFRF